MEFEPNFSPEKNKEQEKTDKEKEWEEIINNLEETEDKLGMKIDEGIKETVAAFQAHKLPTTQSCEGHIKEEGKPYPWIEVADTEKPEEQYIGENKVIQEIAKEKGISFDFLKRYWKAHPEDISREKRRALQEVVKKFSKDLKNYTKEFKEWKRKNKELRKKAEKLIEEFYQEHNYSGTRIKIKDIGFRSRIISIDEKEKSFKDFTTEEKEEILEERQKEMDDFTKFLKDKYFKN